MRQDILRLTHVLQTQLLHIPPRLLRNVALMATLAYPICPAPTHVQKAYLQPRRGRHFTAKTGEKAC